jgi:hypothetical protein
LKDFILLLVKEAVEESVDLVFDEQVLGAAGVLGDFMSSALNGYLSLQVAVLLSLLADGILVPLVAKLCILNEGIPVLLTVCLLP